jgi:hypothetical protein
MSTSILYGKHHEKLVCLRIQAIVRPPEEAAEWLLGEFYPGAELIRVKRVAAGGKPVKMKGLQNRPIRRRS